MRRYKLDLDDNIFNIIDNENKAYFLGLIFANGYSNPTSKSIFLELQGRDIDILQKFKYFLKFTGKISKTFRIRNNKKFYYRRIQFISEQMTKDLQFLNIDNYKTKSPKLPKFSIYFKDFLRGLYH